MTYLPYIVASVLFFLAVVSLVKRKGREKQVKCYTCSHYIDKSDAQEVVYDEQHLRGMPAAYYCPMHKVPFSRVSVCLDSEYEGKPCGNYHPFYSYYAYHAIGALIVDKDGNLEGYKKKTAALH